MKTKVIKGFDCVEMQRQAGLRIYEEIKDMTREQELAYWRKQDLRLARRMAAAKRALKAGRRKRIVLPTD